MKGDRDYHIAVAALMSVAACTTVAASRWLTAALTPFWELCCRTMNMPEGRPATGWPLSIALLFALFGVGLWALSKRLWKSRRFVSGLMPASVAAPPERIAKVAAALKLSRQVIVLRTETPLAFCFGLLQPRICVSTGLADALNDKELKAVLLHEDHHRRRYDPLRALLAEAVGAAFFFLPVAAELRDMFLTSIELEADRHAAGVMGRPVLAGALHKTLTHPLAVRSAQSAAITGLSATEARIAELLNDHPIVLRLSAKSMILTSAIIMLSCMLAQYPLIY